MLASSTVLADSLCVAAKTLGLYPYNMYEIFVIIILKYKHGFVLNAILDRYVQPNLLRFPLNNQKSFEYASQYI